MEKKKPLIYCKNTQKADIRFQDGGLPYALGTKNYQVVRANRADETDETTWTYNHASMLVYWEGRFWIEYISGQSGEHVPPSRTMLVSSSDGIHWSSPVVVFPTLVIDADDYSGPGKESIIDRRISCIMHQRMGFYVSKTGRLLVLGFYGISPEPEIAPNNGYGLGRVVREMYKNGAFSEIYYLRKNSYGGYRDRCNLYFPDYTESCDKEFVQACDELIADKIIRQQWWEEERLDALFFGLAGGKAISCYTLPDGSIMGVCKNAMSTMTDEEGNNWIPLEECPTLETATGKVWGQRTSDGRYALVYNPTTDSAHRWPLAVICGEDGREFDNLLALTPEVTPCRYAGILKNLGPQYVRGIWESYPQPGEQGMWLTYSVNKEDIWVCQVPVPIVHHWEGPVNEILNEDSYSRWNIYRPKWADISLVNHKEGISCLHIEDREPYDRPRALRIFEQAEEIRLTIEVRLDKISEKSGLVIEVQDDGGRTPVRIRFKEDGCFYVRTGGRDEHAGRYQLGVWMELVIVADCKKNRFCLATLQEDKETHHRNYKFSQSVSTLSRILFTTKTILPWNTLEDCGKYGDMEDLPESETMICGSVSEIHSLKAVKIESQGDETYGS